MEQILMLLASAVVGWLARHYGFLAPAAAPRPGPATAFTPLPGAAGAGSLKAEIETIVREAIADAARAAVADVRASMAAPAEAVKPATH